MNKTLVFVIILLISTFGRVGEAVEDTLWSDEATAYRWVTVANWEPISNNNRTYSYGDRCILFSSTRTKVVLASTYQVTLQVLPHTDHPNVEDCPAGTIFLVDVDEVRLFPN